MRKASQIGLVTPALLVPAAAAGQLLSRRLDRHDGRDHQPLRNDSKKTIPASPSLELDNIPQSAKTGRDFTENLHGRVYPNAKRNAGAWIGRDEVLRQFVYTGGQT